MKKELFITLSILFVILLGCQETNNTGKNLSETSDCSTSIYNSVVGKEFPQFKVLIDKYRTNACCIEYLNFSDWCSENGKKSNIRKLHWLQKIDGFRNSLIKYDKTNNTNTISTFDSTPDKYKERYIEEGMTPNQLVK